MARLYDQLYAEAQVALAKLLQGEEREIIKLYGTALYDIRRTLKTIYDKYGRDGQLTHAQMSTYRRLSSAEENILKILKEKMVEVDSLSYRLTGEQFQAAFYRTAYTIDQVGGMSLDWGLVLQEAVEAVVRSPLSKFSNLKSLSPGYESAAVKIRQELGLAVIRGDRYEKLAGRIGDILGVRVSADGKRASFLDKGAAYRSMTIARTEGQRVLAAGQSAAYAKAQEMGCNIEEVWDATLDGRTRPSHGALDGQVKQEKGWFVPEIGWVSAPLHSGVASFDINCRCRIRAQVKGFPPQERYVRGEGNRSYQTYDQWLRGQANKNPGTNSVFEKPIREYQMYKIKTAPPIHDKERKLAGYYLNPAKAPDKARMFASVLDVHQEDYEYLADQIARNVHTAQISFRSTTDFGRQYEAKFSIVGKNGKSAEITTGWIFDVPNDKIRVDGRQPRLTAAYLRDQR